MTVSRVMSNVELKVIENPSRRFRTYTLFVREVPNSGFYLALPTMSVHVYISGPH